MSSQWYYLDDGRVCGPMSLRELWLSAMEGFVDRNTPVRKGAAGKWVPASKVQGLLSRQGPRPLNVPAKSPAASADQPEAVATIPVALDPGSEPAIPASASDVVAPKVSHVSPPSTDMAPSLLPDNPPVPLSWILMGIAGFLVLAIAGAFFLRSGDSLAVSSAIEQPQSEEIQTENDRTGNDQTEQSQREQGPSDSGPREPNVISADDTILKSKKQREQPISPRGGDRESDESDTTMHRDNVDPEPIVFEPDKAPLKMQPEPRATPIPERDKRSESPVTPDPMPSIKPERTKFQDLDEAEQQISILDGLYRDSRDLFAQIAEQREKVKDRERTVAQKNSEIALVQGRLFDAKRILMAYQAERNRVRRQIGGVTPVLDNDIRIALANVNEITNELAKLGAEIQSLMVEDKGGLERVNALMAEVRSVIDDWFVVSGPFGGLLDESYRQIAVQATEWVGESPQFPLAYVARAFASTHLGEFEQALEDYRSAIKEFPDLEPRITAAFGFTLCVQGDLRRAGEHFRKAENIRSEAPWVHVFWGHGLMSVDKPHLAHSHFSQALRQNPEFFFAHHGLAMLGAEGSAPSLDGEDAVKHAEIACDLSDWNEWQPVNLLGMNYAATNQFSRAVEMVKRALARAPKSRRVELQLRLQEYEAQTQRTQ